MIAAETNILTASKSSRSLCPACGGVSLRVRASTTIVYELKLGGPDQLPSVMGEDVSGDGWDPLSEATCPTCGWTGIAGDIEHLVEL